MCPEFWERTRVGPIVRLRCRAMYSVLVCVLGPSFFPEQTPMRLLRDPLFISIAAFAVFPFLLPEVQ
jgi:hypothetical protein